ncbi:MAG: transcription termination/antitermination protein NusG [Vulcanimicrobiota bacterium]
MAAENETTPVEETVVEAPQATAESDEGVESIESVASEPEAPRDPRTNWYVIHTYSGYENKVRDNLIRRIESMNMRDKIFQVLVPTEEELEFKDGKKKTVQRKVYPGYVFVEMIMTEDSWYVVRNTSGVTGFVSPGAKPVPLPDDEVRRIKQIMGMEAPVRVKINLTVGQNVRVIHGPFQDFHGVVDEVSPDREKVRVLISIFGRETPVELDFGQVEKLS